MANETPALLPKEIEDQIKQSPHETAFFLAGKERGRQEEKERGEKERKSIEDGAYNRGIVDGRKEEKDNLNQERDKAEKKKRNSKLLFFIFIGVSLVGCILTFNAQPGSNYWFACGICTFLTGCIASVFAFEAFETGKIGWGTLVVAAILTALGWKIYQPKDIHSKFDQFFDAKFPKKDTITIYKHDTITKVDTIVIIRSKPLRQGRSSQPH